MKNIKSTLFILALAIFYIGCAKKTTSTKTEHKTPSVEVPTVETKNTHIPVYTAPSWSKDDVMYEVNIRQHTKEGTFKAFEKHIPRLQSLGVDILWLMPIYPIGVDRRKGEMGSPYSISDYEKINPSYGTAADFKSLVDATHAAGMKIILDWVPNHTSFDNHWTINNPSWYTKDSLGNITHPAGTDWTDVADLNYDNSDMRTAMTNSMKYWINEFDIDGYRCDVAMEVPNDFWKTNNQSLQGEKHLFMLAEADDPKLHKGGFHATYGWELHHIMNEIAKGKMTTIDLDKFLLKDMGRYQKSDYRLNFITNHDENSWNGTIEERMGDAGDAFAVLSFTLQGMPLIYGGQEAGLNKRLAFFTKDSVDWSDLSKSKFYEQLIDLKHGNKALWNGKYGARAIKLKTDNNKNIYAYKRIKDNNEVVVILNLSNKPQNYNLIDTKMEGEYLNVFDNKMMDMTKSSTLNRSIEAWGYEVYTITK